MKIYYHFTSDKLRDGRPIPAIGEWLTYDGEVKICVSGLHASADPFDALQYAPGHMLHKVVLKGVVERQDDKVVARSRKILATIDATELLRRFARQQALSVIHLWDAPPIVKEYLETRDERLQAAAAGAARDAAWAARAAANAAAAGAAWAAAWAARAAANAAAEAAWAAAGAAANAAAGAAANAAAGAARAAAEAAAEAAENAAAEAAREQFKVLVKKAFLCNS
jgi:hypothetical protein